MKLNTFHLKLIAALTMLIDHIGAFLLPTTHPLYLPMRFVGRIAAPLFWYCFTVGFRRTSNRTEYIRRLGRAALIMGLGNYLLKTLFSFSISPLQPNIFLTMFLMAMAIDAIETFKRDKDDSFSYTLHLFSSLVYIAVCGFFCEYGWYAVLSITILYFLKDDAWKFIALALANIACCWVDQNAIQLAMVAAIPLMMLDSKEKPIRSWKYFFYAFYPIHVWILVALGHFLSI